MQIQTVTRNSDLVIQILESRLDAHNSDELKDYIGKLLENNGKRFIVAGQSHERYVHPSN
ncbi:hypothetical protein MIT9_P2435 [Methylomarinovum caldicuralii]|uniref:Uncharacterized protein n=1 Tax=Methylomarinovum caldicuralii TaxID=438856 RepID=A0AAU9CMD4_9GAMM|nr:hypothetical protein [Methylomarinovum caldicuralii]BCX82846.1 hypothetical protein MIT9_P2435 [Methylomarinovum caldicuralii]